MAKKILIVEHNAIFIDLYKKIFETRFRVEVLNAEDGHEAISIALKESPDLILCDFMLPGGMNGVEVISLLKQDVRTTAIPIVLNSAVANKEQVVAAIDAGASDFLAKPIPERVLVEKVSHYIGVAPFLSY